MNDIKICSKCKIPKPLTEFHTKKDVKSGYKSACKECSNSKSKEYYHDNIVECKDKQQQYRDNNREEIRKANNEASRKYRENNSEKRRESSRKSAAKKRAEEPGRYKKYHDEYVSNNKHVIAANRSKPENKQKKREYNKKFKEQNPDYYYNYQKNVRDKDEQYRIYAVLGCRIRHAIRNKAVKSAKTAELIGCTIPEFKLHIESLFLPTMTWENRGTVWQLDHKLPCASFDLTDPDQQKLCFHYSNLQPLFTTTRVIDGIEYVGNLNKGDMILDTFKRQVA